MTAPEPVWLAPETGLTAPLPGPGRHSAGETPDEQGHRRRGRKAGVPPRWQTLRAEMKSLQPGEILVYDRMAELLDLDPRDPRDATAVRSVARRTAQELRARDKVVVTLIRGKGYRAAEAQDVVVLAHRHQGRAVAEVRTGLAIAESVDLGTVDSSTAALIRATILGFARQEMVMRSLDVRQGRLEAAMGALEVSVRTTATKVQETSTRVNDNSSQIESLVQRLAQVEAELAARNTKTL